MKFYNENKGYLWEFDRFMFFTESEKACLKEGLIEQYTIWSKIEDPNESGGACEMLNNLIKEVEKSK